MSSDTITYVRPRTVSQALAALTDRPYTILAGGTDFYPARVSKPLIEAVLDISALTKLRGIRISAQGFRIGALTTWSDIIRAELPPCFDGLKQAAREIGGVQIQNLGTVGGNLCNASPAADSVPNLLALDAQIELQSAQGLRRLPLAQFILGNRQTARRPDELLSAIYIPHFDNNTRSVFLKLGARRYLVISILMIAVIVQTNPDRAVQDVRIAVGACSEVALRLTELEQNLIGQPYSAALLDGIETPLRAALEPIDDVRASAAYRLDAVAVLLRRAFSQLLEQAA